MNVIDDVLIEISAKASNGLVDFTKPESLRLLREFLQKNKLEESEIKSTINKIISILIPERIAYNSEGYAVIFENEEDKISSLGNGDVTEEPPKDPTKFSYKNDDTVTKDAPKPVPQQNPPAQKQKAPQPENQTDLNKIDATVDPEQRTGSEVKQPDTTPQKNTDGSPNAPTTPASLSDWKHSPEETRAKADALGWEQDELGYFWLHGKLQAITTRKGYIMPILNGDKATPTDWPEAEVSDNEKSSEDAPAPKEEPTPVPQQPVKAPVVPPAK